MGSTSRGSDQKLPLTERTAPRCGHTRDQPSAAVRNRWFIPLLIGRADKLEAGTPPSLSNEKPGCVNSLEGAEINTSLAFRAELLALQAAEFNSQKAVQETLQKSTRTKNTINSKVTQGVNVSRSQPLYTSLVSLAVEEDQLVDEAARDRIRLALPCSHHDDEGPTLSQFFTSDLLREKPLLLGAEPPCALPQLSPDSAHSDFDLYRRQTRWLP
ncbi:protein phosphatase 1 regulatory subunit 35 isoform X3 [Gadus morhua]|uniref:protein phosphatase 1 regulatory subunit 35 isoform X3 n=1 Tax=Gadus morhua TaxID=8049 RepID=UPI0011B49A93|nr:protein phosphatase 1 regulatory subunit 35-like isoform X3 [Gadus morhua]